jgi:branched-chain amino acid transport system ATP-binding protein
MSSRMPRLSEKPLKSRVRMGLILKGENITKVYEGLVALNNVSFQVEEGDIVGLIGPNGAGKTTLLSCISGTETVTEGSLYYREKAIEHLPIYKRTRLGIGRTFQIVQPFKSLTVVENVTVARIFSGRKRSEKRLSNSGFSEIEEILTICGLEKKRSIRADELDLPEQKKLELARALATNAELLLLDEVMAGLNPVEITGILDLIRNVHLKGVTIILVEHIVRAVLNVANRIMVLNYGKKIADDISENVVSNPDVIKAYLGTTVEEMKEKEKC